MFDVKEIAKRAKEVSYRLIDISTEVKNRTLLKAAELIEEKKELNSGGEQKRPDCRRGERPF